jgi:hypothetical protein
LLFVILSFCLLCSASSSVIYLACGVVWCAAEFSLLSVSVFIW